jgi:plasmid stabilization system protein ParE
MTYRIEIAEAAEVEIDAAYLWISRHSPEQAGQWHSGLLEAIESLSEWPRRCPVAREQHLFDGEVRQLLYGRGQGTYRILFAVIDASEPEQLPVVRVLHVRHGAQRSLDEDGPTAG